MTTDANASDDVTHPSGVPMRRRHDPGLDATQVLMPPGRSQRNSRWDGHGNARCSGCKRCLPMEEYSVARHRAGHLVVEGRCKSCTSAATLANKARRRGAGTDTPRHTTAEVAAMTGIPVATLHSHVKRHGYGTLLTPRLRLWSDDDVASLRRTATRVPGRPKKDDDVEPAAIPPGPTV